GSPGTRPDEDCRAHPFDSSARAVRCVRRTAAPGFRLPASGQRVTYPKIELHVHLEATVRPETLLEIAHRNDYPLPANTVEEIAELYRFRDFRHFIEVWVLTTNALRCEADFHQMVVDYAAEAKKHGAVYIEG